MLNDDYLFVKVEFVAYFVSGWIQDLFGTVMAFSDCGFYQAYDKTSKYFKLDFDYHDFILHYFNFK